MSILKLRFLGCTAIVGLLLASGCVTSPQGDRGPYDAPLDQADAAPCTDDDCLSGKGAPDAAMPALAESTPDERRVAPEDTLDERRELPEQTLDAVTCEDDGNTYAVGESWDCDSSCNKCTCDEGGHVTSIELICPETNCQEGNKVYLPGESWDCDGSCNKCTCEDGQIMTTRRSCRAEEDERDGGSPAIRDGGTAQSDPMFSCDASGVGDPSDSG